MRNTTVQWLRSGVVQRAAPLAVQIQNMAWKVAADLGGASPYDSFWIYTTGGGIITVQRGDLLIDLQAIDDLTGQPTKYRIFGNPEMYFSTYARIPAEKLLGS
jgi:hypothetical protein